MDDDDEDDDSRTWRILTYLMRTRPTHEDTDLPDEDTDLPDEDPEPGVLITDVRYGPVGPRISGSVDNHVDAVSSVIFDKWGNTKALDAPQTTVGPQWL